MYTQNIGLENYDNFWSCIDSVQEELSINDKKISDLLNITENNYKSLKDENKAIDALSMANVCRHFNLDFKNLLLGNIDITTLKKHFIENNYDAMPERYTKFAESKSFTLRHILKLASSYNRDTTVLKKLQISHQKIEREDFNISVHAIADAFYMMKNDFTDSDYLKIAKMNAFYFKDSEFGKELRKSKTVRDMYERFLSVEYNLEKNWSYSIVKSCEKEIVINSYPNPELVEAYKKIDYSNIYMTKFRAYFASTLTSYLGLSDAQVKVTKSVHDGHSYCQFKINYDGLRQHPFHKSQRSYELH